MLLGNQKNNVIYYESSEKLEAPWINENSTRHTFADGKGEIELKKSVTKIGYLAFASQGEMTSLMIPDCITEIEYSAFSDCCGMKKLVIGNSVKKSDREHSSSVCLWKILQSALLWR